MLLTVAIVLFVLWALGLATHVVGAAIHLLLVLAVVMFIVHFIRGRASTV